MVNTCSLLFAPSAATALFVGCSTFAVGMCEVGESVVDPPIVRALIIQVQLWHCFNPPWPARCILLGVQLCKQHSPLLGVLGK